MRNKFFAGLSGAIAVFGILMISGCGKNDQAAATNCPAGQALINNVCQVTNNQYNPYGNQYGYNGQTSCPTNQVYTQYGCLAQNAQCGAGQGYSATYGCVPAMNTGYNNGYNNGYNTGYNNGGCAMGQVFTQLGCLPQGMCQMGSGFSQQYNTCIPAMTMNNGYYNGYNGGYTGGAGIGFCIGFGCH